MRKYLAIALAGAATVVAAAPASAALPAVVAPCVNTITPGQLDCRGFFSGQYLSGNAGDIAVQKEALAALGFNWDGNFAAVEKLSGLGGASTVDFAALLNGVTYIGLHFGGGANSPFPNQGDTTGFFKIDASNLDTFRVNFGSLSDAVLYRTGPAVPEPATWAMMIVGMGIVGGAMRRRAKTSTKVSFA